MVYDWSSWSCFYLQSWDLQHMRLWDSATVQWHLMYFDVISRPWTDSSNGWSVPSRAQIFPKSVVQSPVHFCMACISQVAPNSLAEDWNRRFPGRAVRKGYRLVKVPRPRFEHGYNSYTRCYKMLQDATRCYTKSKAKPKMCIQTAMRIREDPCWMLSRVGRDREMLGKMLLVGGNTPWRLSLYVESQVNGVEDYGGIAAELKLSPELVWLCAH